MPPDVPGTRRAVRPCRFPPGRARCSMARMKPSSMEQFISGLRSFTRSELVRAIQQWSDPNCPSLLVAVCACLCAMEPDSPRLSNDELGYVLDILTNHGHDSAAVALRSMAESAANGRVRVEAVRRLGRVSDKLDVRALLRKTITKASNQCGFRGDEVDADDFKQAAAEALGDLSEPCDEDVALLIGVMSSVAGPNNDTPLFRKAAESLRKIARVDDVGHIGELAKKLGATPVALDVLAAASKFAPAVLEAQSEILARSLTDCLRHASAREALGKHLETLARNLASACVKAGIAERGAEAGPHGAVGRIVWAAMTAHEVVDDAFCRACVRLAGAPASVGRDTPLLPQLKRCVDAGFGKRIAGLLSRSGAEGHKKLIESGLLREVYGGADRTVEEIVLALGNEPPIGDVHVWAVLRCVIALCVLEPDRLPSTDSLQRARMRQYGGPSPIDEIAKSLRDAKTTLAPIRTLCRLLFDERGSAPAAALAKHLVEADDAMAELFFQEYVTACGEVAAGTWDWSRATAPFRAFEDALFPKFSQWFQKELPKLVNLAGTLNRYALDLAQRRHLNFVKVAEAAITCLRSPEDADCLLEQLALCKDNSGAKLIGRLVEFPSGEKTLAEHVRSQALRKLAQVCSTSPSALDDPHPDLLCKVYARFDDSPGVRMAAYQFCRDVGDLRSIAPLRKRLQTEADERAKTVIVGALQRLGESLRSSQPDHGDRDRVLRWVGHVQELGERSLATAMRCYLDPPHPDRAVLVAVLECLAVLGGGEALAIVEGFVRETSPSGDILRAARRAKIVLQKRGDAVLFDALGEFFAADAPVLDPSIDYDALLGPRARRLAGSLKEVWGRFTDGDWDDFVTHLDAACDMLVKHLFERGAEKMGLSGERIGRLLLANYANRLSVSEFKKEFPDLQATFSQIHVFRDEGKTAHTEDRDGAEKPGLSETGAGLALESFRHVFPRYVSALSQLTAAPNSNDTP